METLFREVAALGEQIIQFSWVPLLIWTVLSGIVWAALRFISSVHPQYQYHGRLALLFALPVGFIMLGVIQMAGTLFLPSPDESLSLISVTAPFEMTVTPNNSTTISTTEILYIVSFLFLATGLLLCILRNSIQWFQLQRLRANCNFSPILNTSGLDSDTVDLISQTDKNIQIAYLDREIIPVTFGFKRPIILVPGSIRHDTEKLNLVLRHELTHIAQNDFLSNIAISLTQIVFWFHPLVHVLKRELIDYREIRCDSLVLSNQSVSRKKYASLLLELLPMPNINKELSVNMAQESSNLKKRIHMITKQTLDKPIPKRSSAAIFSFIILCTAITMSCTDMQTQNVFDEEELDLMTDVDQTGERGYHQILIYMSDEQQSERHKDALEKLGQLEPAHIQSIEVYKGQQARKKFGERGAEGVIAINTKLDPDSYNTVLKALGMEPQDIGPILGGSLDLGGDLDLYDEKEDFFVVVEDMPELIGGLEEIQKNIRYPAEARRAGIEGRVYVQFIVNEQGDVEDARVIRGIGGGADEEALKVVQQAKFEPGLQRGKPVRVQYSLPIFFRLDNGGQETSSLSEPESGAGDQGLTVTGYGSTEIEDPSVDYKTMEVNVTQSGNTIEGRVVDAETGSPLAGANIILQGTNTGTSTDSNGNFTISAENAGSSRFLVSYIGYQTASYNL